MFVKKYQPLLLQLFMTAFVLVAALFVADAINPQVLLPWVYATVVGGIATGLWFGLLIFGAAMRQSLQIEPEVQANVSLGALIVAFMAACMCAAVAIRIGFWFHTFLTWGRVPWIAPGMSVLLGAMLLLIAITSLPAQWAEAKLLWQRQRTRLQLVTQR